MTKITCAFREWTWTVLPPPPKKKKKKNRAQLTIFGTQKSDKMNVSERDRQLIVGFVADSATAHIASCANKNVKEFERETRFYSVRIGIKVSIFAQICAGSRAKHGRFTE